MHKYFKIGIEKEKKIADLQSILNDIKAELEKEQLKKQAILGEQKEKAAPIIPTEDIEKLNQKIKELEEELAAKDKETVEEKTTSTTLTQKIEEKEKYIQEMEEAYRDNIERTLATIGANLVENENNLLEAREQLLKTKKYAKKLEDKLRQLGYNVVKKA